MVTTDDLPETTLLRPDEVAAFLRISKKTVYRWYASGLLNGIKIGKALRIYRKSVIELVHKEKTQSTPRA